MAKVIKKRNLIWFRRFLNFKTVRTEAGCWEWRDKLSYNGYGLVYFKKRTWKVHRLAYQVLVNPIPKGLWVLHKCDNRKCCNPEHLFLGDVADNMLDAVVKGRFNHRYKYGHRPINAKLDAETVGKIKFMLSEGISIKAISEKLAIGRHLISDIKRGRSYQN